MVSERVCNNPRYVLCKSQSVKTAYLKQYRPQGNGQNCEGPQKKYQTCNAQQCLNVPRLTIKEYAEQICSRAKEVDKDLTGSGMQKISSDRK